MATYEKAIPHILKWEGGYVNNPNDKGGETYRGISRKNHPNWVGWKRIDELKPKYKQIIPELEPAVIAFFKVAYWNKIFGANITSDSVATFIMDWYVNSGFHAIEGAQRLVKVRTDGVMGVNTVRAINTYAGDLLADLKAERTKFVKGIVMRNEKQRQFLDGWLNRINYYEHKVIA